MGCGLATRAKPEPQRGAVVDAGAHGPSIQRESRSNRP
jgi:hypothetical protein